VNRMQVKIKRDGGFVPVYATPGASGADLVADLYFPVTIYPGHRHLIPTGIFLQIPPGYEAQIRPRSGLAAKYGMTVLNTPGTIDSDYRGEIKVLLVNLGDKDVIIYPGDRIAQIVFAPVVRAEFVSCDALDDTPRGAGGFGSTGEVQ
jgi:dUTP pyrophosphatase